MPEVLLRAEHVNKSFGAVVALDGVTLHLPKGEITGLVGDNGAGKSTLIKIISGALTPDAGSIEFDGRPAHFTSPAEARARGVETVYQDLALVGNIAVKLGDYRGVKFTLGRAQDRDDGELVSTVIERPNNPPATVQWLIANAATDPKIVDVVAEGTSLRVTQREDYASFLTHNNNSIAALIDAMRKQVSENS